MAEELLDAVLDRVRDTIPEGWRAYERGRAYMDGEIRPQTVTVAVDYSGTANPEITAVGVDVDVWAPGSGEADDVANAVERDLHRRALATARQGGARLWGGSRETMETDSDGVSHVTMRLTGRAFRRMA